ncbi:MAG: glutathione S-transferase family protein [Marinibacterium sp.]|nr:glutathione S-transferase family protein [Marinibacterium sp.]
MKLYFAPNSRAVRIAWLLEELGLDYDLERFQLGQPEMRAPDYLNVHPMGRVPALQDGDTVMFESGAIIQYILARHAKGRLQPSEDSAEFPIYLQWFHYCEGMVMPPMNSIVVETILLPPDRRSEVHARRATKLLGQMLVAIEQRLEGRDYLVDDFTAADIMTGHACLMSGRVGVDLSALPNIRAYNARLAERPALVRALAL